MKCPLSNYVMERDSGEDDVLMSDCLKEECAWWDSVDGCCILKTISWNLSYLRDVRKEIVREALEKKYGEEVS